MKERERRREREREREREGEKERMCKSEQGLPTMCAACETIDQTQSETAGQLPCVGNAREANAVAPVREVERADIYHVFDFCDTHVQDPKSQEM